jgi:hypothetical protein
LIGFVFATQAAEYHKGYRPDGVKSFDAPPGRSIGPPDCAALAQTAAIGEHGCAIRRCIRGSAQRLRATVQPVRKE